MEQAKHIEFRDDFLVACNQPITVRSRTGTNIPTDRIAPDEIREAVQLILKNGHKFERTALVNEVRTVFGYSRTGGSLQVGIGGVIDKMLSDGLVGEGSTGIGLRT